MNLATVAVKNIRRNSFRTALTVVGVAVAILAFMLLRTVLSAWMVGAEYAAQDRIGTRHKVTFIMTLPRRYADEVRQIEGVRAVTWFNWFGGRLPGREDEFFANMATDPDTLFAVYDDIELPEAHKQAWRENRRGAVVGAKIARQFGWKVGDRVTLAGTIFPGEWEFFIEGVYKATRPSIDESSFFFHWDYLNESVGPALRDQVGWIASRIDDASAAATISKRIDERFDTRDIQTLSMSERALSASFLGMLGALLKALDLVSVVILGIMMLILGNTIAMGVRERVREYGTLRAIGFMPRHIAGFVIGEAAVIGVLGALLGIGIAYPLINQGLGVFIEDNFSSFFPYFRVMERDVVLALISALVLAGLAACIPAWGASRTHVTDALRRIA